MERIPVIRTRNLSIGYVLKGGHLKLVHDALDLNLYPGEVTCLLGLNGAGKSTLLRTLCGFQPSLGGEIELKGKPLASYSQGDFSRMVGVVLTEKTNAGGITVYELVSLGRHPYTGFFGQLRQEDRRIIEESLAAAGIAHKAYNYVSELSDGERQKAMIAKALAQQCPIILLDEPTAFLDVTSRIETMVLLHKLAVKQQKAILLSTFFSKEGIVFDPNTGKLNTAAPTKLIGVEGDFMTSYWVGNALIRNGFKPSSVSEDYISVYCNAPDSLRIQFPAEEGTRIVGSVAEMISIIIHKS